MYPLPSWMSLAGILYNAWWKRLLTMALSRKEAHISLLYISYTSRGSEFSVSYIYIHTHTPNNKDKFVQKWGIIGWSMWSMMFYDCDSVPEGTARNNVAFKQQPFVDMSLYISSCRGCCCPRTERFSGLVPNIVLNINSFTLPNSSTDKVFTSPACQSLFLMYSLFRF